MTKRQTWSEIVRKTENISIYIFTSNTKQKKRKLVVGGKRFCRETGCVCLTICGRCKIGKERLKECWDCLNPIGTHKDNHVRQKEKKNPNSADQSVVCIKWQSFNSTYLKTHTHRHTHTHTHASTHANITVLLSATRCQNKTTQE